MGLKELTIKLLLILLSLNCFPSILNGQNDWHYDVFFQSGNWKIEDNQIESLFEDLKCLEPKQIVEVELNSFTDTVGNLEDNQILSQQRLDFILDELKKNIDTSQVKTILKSNGEKSSINKPLAFNRKVTIRIQTQDIVAKAGMGLKNKKYSLYATQKDSTACNQFVKIIDRITREEYEAFPNQPKKSTVYTVKTLIKDSSYSCYGHVFFFKEGNYDLQDSIGWFDQSVLINDFCGGRKVDSLDFKNIDFTIRFDKTDNGFYVFKPYCYKHLPHCICGGVRYCKHALILPDVFTESQVVFTYIDTVNYFDSTLNRDVRDIRKRSIKKSDNLAYIERCYADSLKIFVKWGECLWQTKGSFQYFLNRTDEKLIDSLRKVNAYYHILKRSKYGQQVYISTNEFKPVYFNNKKIVIKSKHADEAGIFLPEFEIFIPYKKKWFNRYVGYEIEDFQYTIMIKKDGKILPIEDYQVKIRNRTKKSVFKFKRRN